MPGKPRWVLDTAALLNGAWDRDADRCVVPPAVRAEIRPGGRDHARFERLIAAGLTTREPAPEARERVRATAAALGEARLSAADLEVAALLMTLGEEAVEATAVTDDYALQNLMTHLELPFRAARMEGIREKRRYALRCTGCGRWWPPTGPMKDGEECPVCGSAVARRRERA